MKRYVPIIFWVVIVLSLIMSAALGNFKYTLLQLPISIGLTWAIIFLPLRGVAYFRSWENGLRASLHLAWFVTMIAFLAGWTMGMFIFLFLWSEGSWQF